MNIQWKSETALAMLAAAEGGRIALGRPAAPVERTKESARDVVSSVDLMIEQHIRAVLAESGHKVIGEEQELECAYPLEMEGPVWVVDPIDGTANYVNGMDYFAVSVGLCRGKDFLVGAVCLPSKTELYCTLGEHRSLLNGRTLIHAHRGPDNALVAASFSGTIGDQAHRQRQYLAFGEINDATRGCLRLGSAAANLCLTAAGRLQAAYGFRARVWDVAAGLAIAAGAGCKVVLAASKSTAHVDYVVGSRDTVSMIHELCLKHGLMEEQCQIW
jgi:myo-inositol-1(or 4)-monophosphatase